MNCKIAKIVNENKNVIGEVCYANFYVTFELDLILELPILGKQTIAIDILTKFMIVLFCISNV